MAKSLRAHSTYSTHVRHREIHCFLLLALFLELFRIILFRETTRLLLRGSFLQLHWSRLQSGVAYNQHSKQHGVSWSNYNRLVRLRHQAHHFVSTLQQYVLSQLSDVSWSRFVDSLTYQVLVEIVKLIQKQGMRGEKGGWKEFLKVYDTKLGDSLSDPARRSPDVLLAFTKSFKEERDVQVKTVSGRMREFQNQLHLKSFGLQVKIPSKHCRTCNRCVEGFDQHCKLNNCVGKKNYTNFIFLMVFVLLLLSIEGGTTIAVFVRCFADKKGMEHEIAHVYKETCQA